LFLGHPKLQDWSKDLYCLRHSLSINDNMSSMDLSYYPQAVLLPILAFPSWILCIPPLFWHFRQSNIAAGSLILWVGLINFFNSINPLIWPRDNLPEWWDGKGWCDINVRIQVGAVVGTTASAAMIVRKLAKVMDTSNITVSVSRQSKIKEKVLEVVWCWVYPLVLIIVYYVVQPARYFIYGISGCLSTFDPTWPSVVLIIMWAPITTLVAACYAGKSCTPPLNFSSDTDIHQSFSPTASTATAANSSALSPSATQLGPASSASL
jgi:pheromone a factor receptor